MRIIIRNRVKVMSMHFCRWTVMMVCALSVGLYAGFYISVDKNIKCSLEVCDKDVKDIDFYRNIFRDLQTIADEIEGTGSENAVLVLQNVMAALDPQHALAAQEKKASTTEEKPKADACGEIFTMPELPFYQKGFVPDPTCNPKDKPPLQSLVTVLMLAPHAKQGVPLDKSLAPVRNDFPGLSAIITTVIIEGKLLTNKTEVLIASESAFTKPGALWNKMLSRVRTPYVLVARGAVRVDELSRLPRLVYVLTATRDGGVAVVGGALRHASGRWRAGCLQTQLRHYALRLLRGYHHSALDCMLCDHLEGPFLVRADLLREVPFHEELPAAVLFEDWFLRVKRRGAVAAVCPDVLFFVSEEQREPQGTEEQSGERREAWRQLALHWQLDRVLPPGRPPLRFSCAEVGFHCNLSKIHRQGLLMPTCCVEQFVGALQAFDQFATRHGLDYEVGEGTSLGAVKLRSILPWDVDGDIFIRLADFDIYRQKQHEMSQLGYYFKHFTEDDKFKYFYLYTPDDTIDMWCRPNMSTSVLPEEMRSVPTRVEINGLWLRGFWNPGLTARNRYGPGYLKHALHWKRQGMHTHMDAYKVGNWGNCSFENHHSCLNRYPTEGSFDLLLDDFFEVYV